MRRVSALITNDDGIDSPGIRALAEVAVDAGLDSTVAAPGWDSSGASASLTAVQKDGRVVAETVDLDGLEGVKAFRVEAAPAFIVRAAVHGAFGERPNVVLSGVNHGPNTGYAVLHSGTVGAALTAATYGCHAMAVSLGHGPLRPWGAVQRVVRPVLGRLLQQDAITVFNVNVPNLDEGTIRGIRFATLARFGAVQTQVTEAGKGHVKLTYRELEGTPEPGSDATLLADGFATVTALRPVCLDESVEQSELSMSPHAHPRDRS